MTPEERKPPTHYVSNPDLTKTLGDWSQARRQAFKAGAPIPPLPDAVGEAALKIATRMSTKYNYASYTWREDLIGTAVLAVVQYVHSFDSTKSSNAFAYISQIVTNAFSRLITSEKRQSYITAVIARSTGNFEHLEDVHDEVIISYETYKESKRKKSVEALQSKEAKAA